MKRILVCLDASPRAPLVLGTAAKLAAQLDAQLFLLRSVGLPSAVDQEALAHAPAAVLETMTAKAKLELEAHAKELPAGVAIGGIDVHVGTPWDTICREAKALECDLVVLGSHGYSGFDRVLGTTAAKVVNNCDRSVFVVRPGPGRDGPRLLVAVDTSDNATLVVTRAIELALALGGRLRLLSVVQMPPFVSAPPVEPSYINPSGGVAEAEAMLRAREQEVPPALRDGFVVKEGIVSDAVCAVARSYDADLVIVGAHRHGLLARMLGTTAATIINHIDRPVIVVRPTPATLGASCPKPASSDSIEPSKARKHDNHPLLEGATLTGAAVGAAVGAAAGPPGAVLGGVLGVGVGMLAGVVLDDETSGR